MGSGGKSHAEALGRSGLGADAESWGQVQALGENTRQWAVRAFAALGQVIQCAELLLRCCFSGGFLGPGEEPRGWPRGWWMRRVSAWGALCSASFPMLEFI